MSTPIPLWQILALLAAVVALSSVHGWIGDRWEFSRARPRVTRRWYGIHAQVTQRAEAGSDDPDRYVVLAWDSENTAVPWLKVHKLDPEYLTYWDEDAEPFWAPATGFAPYAVRRFRPGVTLIGRVPVLRMTNYPPLPYPARIPEEARDAA